MTLIEREYYRFIRLAAQTIVPPIIMTILFIIIFGYSLGKQIEEISGFPYIVYILPGVAGMGMINNAFSNSATSLFMSRTDRSIENIMVAPLSHLKIVLALVIGGMTRGLVVGGITLLVASLLTELTLHSVLWSVAYLFLISIIFSSLGVVAALWAEDWDHLATLFTFIITPFIYLGGVFYSVSMLPPLWQKASLVNPMYYMIDGFRWAVLGQGDLSPWISGGVTFTLTLSFFTWAVWLFKRGYKLVV